MNISEGPSADFGNIYVLICKYLGVFVLMHSTMYLVVAEYLVKTYHYYEGKKVVIK